MLCVLSRKGNTKDAKTTKDELDLGGLAAFGEGLSARNCVF